MKLAGLKREDIPLEFTREILHWTLVRNGVNVVFKGKLSVDPDSDIQTTPLTNFYLGNVPDRRLWFKTENGSYYFVKCEGKTLRWWLDQFGPAAK